MVEPALLMTREEWDRIHRDYKVGKPGDEADPPRVLQYEEGGTVLVPVVFKDSP